MSILIIVEPPNATPTPSMIEERKMNYTIYTDMPQPFSHNHGKEPNFFLGLADDPHDDETDEEIEMDVEDDPDDERDLPVEKIDLLTQLKKYLAHLPTQTNSSVTEEEEEEEEVEPIFVPIVHPRRCTNRSTTKKHRKHRSSTSNTTTPSKPSRKALPKNSY